METQIQAAQAESKNAAVIRVTSYHRKDYDHFGIYLGQEHHRPILSSIAAPFPSTATGKCGTMDGLPVEIMQEICGLLDVESCINFRQVNRWTRAVVSSMPQYRAVATHALECLCAVLKTGLGSAFTFTDLYDCLCSSTCIGCHRQFGTHVYLFTMVRYCRSCLDDSTNQDALRIINAIRFKRITNHQVDSLAMPILKFRALAGRYNSHQNYIWHRKRQVMVNHLQARRALQFTNTPMFLDTGNQTKEASYMPWIATVTMPHYNLATSITMAGLACKGCARNADRFRSLQQFKGHLMNKTYTTNQFLNHVQSCARAQKLWRASKNGKLSVDHLISKFVKNGGLAVTGNPLRYSYNSQ
ncbi:hypothetical protein DL546_007750 [Coniochaeta pulveracea]|uniref:F-box domain-containing protein n=1 Tax=Coniochaeta pulveracea TaxID=177199 RepID=A0A420YCH7_9PEZI|nr:hypothetical protein DL546_007750 [Coniochaeta pulveracea]